MLAMIVEDLSDAERKVWSAFPAGRPVNLLTGNPEDDDPACGELWEEGRHIHANVLLALLCGVAEAEAGLAGAIRLRGARVLGRIDLTEATFKKSILCY